MSGPKAEASARLAQRQQLRSGDGTDGEDPAAILRARAEALARPIAAALAPAAAIDLLVFSRAGERYGVELSRVIEVVDLHGLTPVPGTPLFLLGVVNYRGQVLPVVDVTALFGVAVEGPTDLSKVAVVKVRDMAFGLLADSVAADAGLDAQAIGPPPVGLAGQGLVSGVGREMLAVLDLDAMVRDPRFMVDDAGD